MKKHHLYDTNYILLICTLAIFVIACDNRQGPDNADANKILERVVSCDSDSIGWKDPFWESVPSVFNEVRLIDIKMFNDTIFLFAITERNDSILLYTYYWDEIFHFFEERTIHMESPMSDEDELRTIAAISYDTILFVRYRAIELYDFLSNNTFYQYRIKPYEIFVANFSPVQYCFRTQKVFTEYINYHTTNSRSGKNERSLYCEFSLKDNLLVPLPFPVPKTKEFKSQHANTHFALTDQGVVVKHSIANEFEIYHRNRDKSDKLQIRIHGLLPNVIPEGNTTDPDQIGSFFKRSAIQSGLSFNRERKILNLFYLMPLPERDKNGLKPDLGDKPLWIINFDSDFRPVEKLILDQPGFIASMYFPVNDKIFMVSDKIIYTIIL